MCISLKWFLNVQILPLVFYYQQQEFSLFYIFCKNKLRTIDKNTSLTSYKNYQINFITRKKKSLV